jgi:hypothetical protein
MTITLTREEAQQVLDALAPTYKMDLKDPQFQAVKILCTALAQPEPEPVAWMTIVDNLKVWEDKYQIHPVKQNGDWFQFPVYLPGTALPQREWQGLTDEQIKEITKQFALSLAFPYDSPTTPEMFARAIEAKLREKNA